MASFNIMAFNGETGDIRDGIMFPELLKNQLNRDYEIVGTPEISRGIVVGAQMRPIKIEDRQVLVPRRFGEVAWQGESTPLTRTSNRGQVYAAAGSVDTIRTEAGGFRHLIVAPKDGDQSVLVFVQTGLPGNGKMQEAKLFELLNTKQAIFEHGAFALDTGARGLVRKIRTSITRSGGMITRVNQLIEVQPNGAILVAGMLNESAIWRLANQGGKLRKVDAGENPRALFAKLRGEQRRTKADAEDEMPLADKAA